MHKETLRQKQSRFVKMVAKLIEFAYSQGFELTFGDTYPSKPHKKNSLHCLGLAIDFNLFKNGVYMDKTPDHLLLGTYWESIGGSWGGRFGDGNHYSLEHNGIK